MGVCEEKRRFGAESDGQSGTEDGPLRNIFKRIRILLFCFYFLSVNLFYVLELGLLTNIFSSEKAKRSLGI